MAEKFLDQRATADLLGVSVRTLERWRTDGAGPAYVRLGPRRIAYREADVIRWAEGNTHSSLAAELAAKAA